MNWGWRLSREEEKPSRLCAVIRRAMEKKVRGVPLPRQ